MPAKSNLSLVGCALALTSCALLLQMPARAALPDEIQVYNNDINAPGEKGLELHVNTTPRGNTQPGYVGERITDHGWRLTPEFSYGLSKTLEAGLYLPMVFGGGQSATLAGVKLRLKWLPLLPQDGQAGFYAGTNVELSRVKYQFDDARSVLELRNIIGWQGNDWSFSSNPIFRWGLTPGYRGAPDFSLGLRLMSHLTPTFRTGMEFYSGFGPASAIVSRSQQERLLFGIVEVDLPSNWSIQFGIGHGSGSGDPWTVKSIISFPL